jgi:hypothetical protein
MGVRGIILFAALFALGCQGASAPAADENPATAAPSASAAAAAIASASADAPDAGPDMSVAKPLSPRLAAKLAQSIDAIKAAAPPLVAKLGGGRMEVVDDTFVLVAGEKNAPLDDAVKTVHAATQALWHGLFWHRPSRGAVVWVFSSRDTYGKFVTKYAPKGAEITDLSFYVPESAHVPGASEVYFCAEGQGIHGVAHEVAHHLLSRGDFPTAPRFIQEGIPALLEAADPQPDTGDLRLKAHFRLQSVRDALTKPNYASWCTVQALFDVTEDSFWGFSEPLAYALSREFLRFLEVRKHALVPFYRAFREGILDDPSGRHALTAATGAKQPYELTDEFQEWIRSKDAEQDEP